MKRSALAAAAIILLVGVFAVDSQARTITGSEVWTPAGNPHIETENLTIGNGGSLTIESGCVVKLNTNVLITVSDNGVLDATGATFTWADEVNEWRGIYFVSPDSRNRLINCTIEHAKGYTNSTAYDPAMLHIYTGGGSPLIQGCTIGIGTALNGINVVSASPQILNNPISGRSGSGIFVSGTTFATITGNQLTNNAAGVHIDYGTGTDPTVTGNIYSGNSQCDVRTEGNISVNTDWNEAAGTVYRVVSSFSISANASVTISEGIIVKLSPDVLITVSDNGVLDATGATFTWTNEVNEWRGIYFVSPDSRNRLINCTIEHAKGYTNSTAYDPAMIHIYIGGGSPLVQGCTIGNGTAPNGINVVSASPQLLTNTISGRSGSGIYVNSSAAPLVAGNLITGNAHGIGIFGGAAGLYRVNRIQGNTGYGLYNGNSSSSPSINARYNWWGNSTGPLAPDNPLGTGDRITTKVDYFPWAGSIADTDADSIWDDWEAQQFTNLNTASLTSDHDLDGLLDKDEFLYGTDPKNRDSDGDGVEDGLEVQVGMNPSLASDYNLDYDNDTYSNLREQISGTNPYNAASIPPVLADGDPLPSGDGDVDGRDLFGLISEYGRTNCSPCQYDLDTDGDVDLADLFLFTEDFGRTTP